jgi:hypothetical protein
MYVPLGAITLLILNIKRRIGNPYYPGYVAGTVVCREYSASVLDIQQLRHLSLGNPRGKARILPGYPGYPPSVRDPSVQTINGLSKLQPFLIMCSTII